MNIEKDYFDLNTPLMFDTYLTVKYGMKMCHYNIPLLKRNGTPRTYGELYYFYTSKPDFKMAIGYKREEDQSGKYWTAKARYLYFDKNQLPHLSGKILSSPLLLAK